MLRVAPYQLLLLLQRGVCVVRSLLESACKLVGLTWPVPCWIYMTCSRETCHVALKAWSRFLRVCSLPGSGGGSGIGPLFAQPAVRDVSVAWLRAQPWRWGSPLLLHVLYHSKCGWWGAEKDTGPDQTSGLPGLLLSKCWRRACWGKVLSASKRPRGTDWLWSCSRDHRHFWSWPTDERLHQLAACAECAAWYRLLDQQVGGGGVPTRVKLNADTDSIHLLQVYFGFNDRWVSPQHFSIIDILFWLPGGEAVTQKTGGTLSSRPASALSLAGAAPEVLGSCLSPRTPALCCRVVLRSLTPTSLACRIVPARQPFIPS